MSTHRNHDATARGRRRELAAAATGLALVALGCRTAPPPPLELPPLRISLDHFAGSPLSGPGPLPEEVAATSPGEALSVSFEVYYLRRGSIRVELQGIASRSTLVASMLGEDPFRASPDVAAGGLVAGASSARALAVLLAQEDAPKLRLLARRQGALPRGVSVRLALADDQGAWSPEHAVRYHERVDVMLHRDEHGTIRAVLESVTRGPALEPFSTEVLVGETFTPSERVVLQEVVGLEDAPELDGAPLFLLDSSTAAGEGMLAVRVDLISPPASDEGAREHAEALSRCLAQAARPIDYLPRLEPLPLVERTDDQEATKGGVDLGGRDTRIASMVIANATGATLTEDFVLSAPSDMVAELAKRWRVLDKGGSAEDFSWQIDRFTLEYLAESALDARLPPELEGILLRHTGEGGRFPDLIVRILSACHGHADLDRALVAENRQFLRDAGPAPRSRAHAWLDRRGLAPPGYDPLSSNAERTYALDADELRRRYESQLDEAPEAGP